MTQLKVTSPGRPMSSQTSGVWQGEDGGPALCPTGADSDYCPRCSGKLTGLSLFKKAFLLCASLLAFALAAGRLSAESPWAPPVNLSASGAASQPAVAVNADGTLYVLWWDAFDGTLYARANALTGTLQATPVAAPQIVGDRKLDQKTGQVTALAAPRDVRLMAGSGSAVQALWFTTDGQLMAAQASDLQWGQAITLATSVQALDVASDISGTVRLAYARSGAAGGIYYVANGGSGWSVPVAVSTSPYLRVVKPEAAHVGVAGLANGQALVVWDDPLSDQSVFSRSADGGKTWDAPLPVVGRQSTRVQHVRVAAAANGEFLLIWQDAASGGCGLTQRRSADGGQTWSTPERILTGLARCPARWQFSSDSAGRLWLLGLPAADQNTAQTATLAAWDGKAWSDAVDVSISFQNPASGRSATLGCLSVALGGDHIGVVGCDDKGDVWATTNAVPLDQIVPALRPLWSAISMLSDGNAGPVDLPAVAADSEGRLYVMWSQGAGRTDAGPSLYLAAWDGMRWGRASRLFTTAANPAGIVRQAQLRADQPALAVDGRGRLHAVWSGGTSGQVMYSWVGGRDAASPSAWSEPEAVPSLSAVGGWPDIIADPRGDVLHLVYAVPYNEHRGIYYSRVQGSGGRDQGTGDSDRSAVNGQWSTWLTPTIVFDAVAAGWESVSKPRLALDAQTGTLHAVWLRTALPGGVGIQAVYYARSNDDGQTWSAAQKLAEGLVDWPRVAVAGKQVHVLWNKLRSDGTAELWSQYSTDGIQWSQAGPLRGFDRLSGPVGIVADGAGALYVTAVGQGMNGESMLLYGRWDGATWGKSEGLALGQGATLGQGAAAVLTPAQSGKQKAESAAVRRLVAVLRQSVLGSDGLLQFVIAASGRDVPAAPVTPAPTFTPLPSPTPTVTPTPRATPTPVRQFPMPETTPPAGGDLLAGQLPLLLGGSLALVLVLGAVLTRGLWGMRR